MLMAEAEVKTVTRGYRRSRRHREMMRQRLRGEMDVLIRRSDALPEWERVLVELHLREGVSLKVLARSQGHSVAWLRRRLCGIKRRLRDPRFLAASSRAGMLPEGLRRVTKAYYLERRSLRECAAKFGMTVHGVRQALVAARTLLMMPGAEVQAEEE